jgi:hypothetical protein
VVSKNEGGRWWVVGFRLWIATHNSIK